MPAFNRVVIQSGNLIDMEDQICLVGQSTSEELTGCIKKALGQWSEKDESDEGVVVVQGCRKPLLYTNRGISTTVKIFLSDYSVHSVTDAIDTVLRNVGRERLDCVILSPPDISSDACTTDLLKLWRGVEGAVTQGKVRHIGVSDLGSQSFKQLYHWATIKPSTIQVNLTACCNVDSDLEDFARENDVQMMTHADDPEMVEEDLISAILKRIGYLEKSCALPWVARHRTINTSFGVILDKGYTLALDLCEP